MESCLIHIFLSHTERRCELIAWFSYKVVGFFFAAVDDIACVLSTSCRLEPRGVVLPSWAFDSIKGDVPTRHFRWVRCDEGDNKDLTAHCTEAATSPCALCCITLNIIKGENMIFGRDLLRCHAAVSEWNWIFSVSNSRKVEWKSRAPSRED